MKMIDEDGLWVYEYVVVLVFHENNSDSENKNPDAFLSYHQNTMPASAIATHPSILRPHFKGL